MKLIVQIPCLNEENTLPLTVAEISRDIPGVSEVELLVIDDGSTDRTVEVARSLGIDHIVRHQGNRGLAVAFQSGLDACLQAGADIIVNTDGDNQYPGSYIPALIAPILRGEADMVVADRQVDQIKHFSLLKKLLLRVGNASVRFVSGTSVPDSPSGFRALSREAALRINVVTGYTYTLETVVQAGKKNLRITQVPIVTNPKLRESRLMGSTWSYVRRSAATILRLFALYEPLRAFSWISLPFFLGGATLWVRFLWILAFSGEDTAGRHVQSVIVGAALLIIGFLAFLFGVLADLVATNRRLHEETLFHLKRLSFGPGGNRPTNDRQGDSGSRAGPSDHGPPRGN